MNKKVELEYEIGLAISNKGNQVVQLKVVANEKERFYYGDRAVKQVQLNLHIYGKEDHKYIRGLKKLTDTNFENLKKN